MYCSNCGQEIFSSDNFCSKCGKKLANITKTETENKNNTDAPVNSKKSIMNDKPEKNNCLYSIIYLAVGLAIIGCIAAVLIPGLASGKIPDGQGYFSLCFWFGLGGLIIGKHKSKSGWPYFFAGCASGLIVGFILTFIIGLVG